MSHDGDSFFRSRTIKTSTKPQGESNSGGSGGGAKPISYDTYSTDTSSQFSVDIVEVAPRGLELEDTKTKEQHQEVVLNASRLQVESEK